MLPNGPRVLAVLASPSLLLLWDARGGGGVLWKRDISVTEVGGMAGVGGMGCAHICNFRFVTSRL